MSQSFVHLHNHTEYSILDGYGSVKDMVERAVELDQAALAITDHGSMYGVVDFYRSCRKHNIKPIIGCELYITDYGVDMHRKETNTREYNHLLVLARNQQGYRNLLQLSSIGWLEGFYYKPRIDYSVLEQHKDGLLVTSGCMASNIPSLILSKAPKSEIQNLVDWYKSVFGENFYIELQHHPGIPEIIGLNYKLIALAQEFSIPMIATNDAHYARPGDADIHDTMLCVQTKSYKAIPRNKRFGFTDDEYYLKSLDEMRQAFSSYGLNDDIFTNTLEIVDKCDANPDAPSGVHHMPDVVVANAKATYDDTLIDLVERGMRALKGDNWANDLTVKSRLDEELAIIKETGFSQYYLIVNDIIDFARQNNILWNIRGSGASSYVCYALGLSFIDPIENKLLFDRFLNKYRVTTPDLDIDFPDSRRNEVITYLVKKYGEDRVAQIATFSRMKARMVVRDIGRVYGISQEDIDVLAKQVPNIPGKPITIADSLNPNGDYPSPELIETYAKNPDAKLILDLGKRLESKIRQVGIHAAAVIISDRPITEYTALMRPSATSITKHITQLDYPTLESLGLLKVDCLGLATLSIIEKACELINLRHNVGLTPFNIPINDASAFELLSSGETHGVFQVESSGLRNVLMAMCPTEFQHIMDVISLYRPGPIGHIPEYIERMHGQESIVYADDMLGTYLDDTQGIIIYQEQIIAILAGLAGYAPGEADIVRKGISKKDQTIIDRNRQKFIDGCVNAHGMDKDVADVIWGDIEKFSLYGFNRAHAASYARITMQTAYLKAHYPIEFMTACLTVEGSKYEKVREYIAECRRMGISVLPPDINSSGYNFTIVKGHNDLAPSSRYNYRFYSDEIIRFGISSIKSVGEVAAQELAKVNNFTNINDIMTLVKYGINRRSLEALIGAGMFDAFYPNKAKLYTNAESIIEQAKRSELVLAAGQRSFFKPQLNLVTGANDLDLAQIEFDSLGVWINEHPLDKYQDVLDLMPNSVLDINEEMVGEQVRILAAAVEINKVYDKNSKPMMFLKLSDRYGIGEAIVFSKNYVELVDGEVILVSGFVRMTHNHQTPTLIIDKIANNLVFTKKLNKIKTKLFTRSSKEEVLPPNENLPILTFAFRIDDMNIPDLSGIIHDSPGNTLTIYKYMNGEPGGVKRYKNSGIILEDGIKIGLKNV